MAKDFKVGDFARNVESHWLGKIQRIYNEPYQVESDGPTYDCFMAEMIGVDTLAATVAGLTWEECLSSNDIQHHALADLIPAGDTE